MEFTHLLNTIKDLCNKNGISQNKAFIESGVGKDFVYNIRKNKSPSITKIQQLATYFNVSTDYLLGIDENEQKETRPSEEERVLKLMNENKSFSELIEIMATLSEDELDKLADYTRWRAAELEKGHQK